MKLLIALVLMSGQFHVVRTRNSDGVVTFIQSSRDGDLAAAGTVPGESAFAIPYAPIPAPPVDPGDNSVLLFKVAGGAIVPRSAAEIRADVAQSIRRRKLKRLDDAEAQLARVQARLVANPGDADLTATQLTLQAEISALKTATNTQ